MLLNTLSCCWSLFKTKFFSFQGKTKKKHILIKNVHSMVYSAFFWWQRRETIFPSNTKRVLIFQLSPSSVNPSSCDVDIVDLNMPFYVWHIFPSMLLFGWEKCKHIEKRLKQKRDLFTAFLTEFSWKTVLSATLFQLTIPHLRLRFINFTTSTNQIKIFCPNLLLVFFLFSIQLNKENVS